MNDTPFHPYIVTANLSILNISKPNRFFYFRKQEELEKSSYCFFSASVPDRMLSCSLQTFLKSFPILRYLMSLTTLYQMLKARTWYLLKVYRFNKSLWLWFLFCATKGGVLYYFIHCKAVILVCLLVSAVHFTPYLTGLSSMMLIWAAWARCKWRVHLHNWKVPWFFLSCL